jgi:hypothetical protein
MSVSMQVGIAVLVVGVVYTAFLSFHKKDVDLYYALSCALQCGILTLLVIP